MPTSYWKGLGASARLHWRYFIFAWIYPVFVCGRHSALRHPAHLGIGLLVVPLILFVLLCINFAWLNWWLIVPALVVGVLWSYAATPLVTRLLNRYVRLDGAPE
jgi:hypothetical protein